MKCMKQMCNPCFMLPLIAAGCLAPSPSVADDDVWEAAVNGSWSAGLFWVDGTSPDSAADKATIAQAGAYTVSFVSNPNPIGELRLQNAANVTFVSSAKPPAIPPPRTFALVTSGGRSGDLVIFDSASLTLGDSVTPFHLTADTLGVGGALNVKFGSDVTAEKLAPSGQLNITGAGSTVTVTSPSFWYDGQVDVTLGGLMQTEGLTNGGTVAVSGVGSHWINTGQLQIGYQPFASKNGLVSVTGGGLLESASTILGYQQGSATGTVTVTDSGSLWRNTTNLLIGGISPGTVNVQPGGTVVTGTTLVASQGRLRLQGGTFDTPDLSFQSGGQFEWTAGTLHVGTYHGNLSFAVGTLAPGHSPGSTSVTGIYMQGGAGKLEIEIGGAAQGTLYDVVNVTGNASLGGQLDLKLINGFVPTSSQTFTIMSANSIAGSFANVANGGRINTTGGGSFRVNYGPGSAFAPSLIVLSAFQSALAGDFDVDNDVDGNDFLLWQRGGSPNPNSPADLALWRANFGAVGAVAATAAVPEPSAVWLAILAISLAKFSRAGRLFTFNA